MPTVVLLGTLARARRDVDYSHGNEATMAELFRIFDDGWGTDIDVDADVSSMSAHRYGSGERCNR